MQIFYKEDGGNTIINFFAERFTPLDYFDFQKARLNGIKSFEIRCETKSISITQNHITRVENDQTITIPVNFNEPLPIYALVPGGWLPPPFVKPKCFLTDSNVIGSLDSIKRNNSQAMYGQMNWWFQLFGDSDLVLNPLPYALEGNQLKTPSLNEIKTAFFRATEAIRSRFPKATIVEYDEIQFRASHQLISNLSSLNSREADFLVAVVPLIKDTVPQDNLAKIEYEILKNAKRFNVGFFNLSVLAALSCLYDDGRNGATTARKILLKPSQVYDKSNAYNALADLNSIRVFLGMLTISKANALPEFAFCTSDKAIVQFWSGLKARNIRFDAKRGGIATYALTGSLFPRLSVEELKKLANRLSQP